MEIELLKNANPDDIPALPRKGELIDCRVVDVYDGDTCTVLVCHEGKLLKTKIRIAGVDTPEIRSKSELESKAATFVRDRVREKIQDRILKIKLQKFDKYGGRIVGCLYLSEEETLADALISQGFGKSYNGRAKETWKDEDFHQILN